MKKLSFFSVLVFLFVFAQLFAQPGSRRVIEVKGRAADTVEVVDMIYAIAVVKDDPLFPTKVAVKGDSDTINQVLANILSDLDLEALEQEEDFEVNPITGEKGVFYVRVKDLQTLHLLVSRLRQQHQYLVGRIHETEYANLSQLENRLKVEAVRNARTIAEEMLNAAGARITHVVSIQDRGVRPSRDNENPLKVILIAEVVVTFAIR